MLDVRGFARWASSLSVCIMQAAQSGQSQASEGDTKARSGERQLLVWMRLLRRFAPHRAKLRRETRMPATEEDI